MKHQFMNKENGKTARVLVMFLDDKGLMQTDVYDTVEDLLADYGAYESQTCEPLIKDEKIRKAVRAWAEALCLSEAYCASNGYEIYGGADDHIIQFPGEPFPFADKNKIYTIDELCGEEAE